MPPLVFGCLNGVHLFVAAGLVDHPLLVQLSALRCPIRLSLFLTCETTWHARLFSGTCHTSFPRDLCSVVSFISLPVPGGPVLHRVFYGS